MINPNRSTGPLIPGTATDTSGGLAYWTAPNNAKVEDGSSASDGNVGPGGGGHGGYALELTSYGFNLPASAIIDGIKLEAKVMGFGGMHDDLVYLKWASGTIGNFQNAPGYGQFWGTSLNWLTWGGPTSLWGRTWTAAEINNVAFGAGLAGFPNTGTATASIDAVKITVYWHYDNPVAPAEVPQRYDYHISDPFGKFLGNLPAVVSPFSTVQALNSTGAQLTMQVAGTPDGQQPALALGNLKRWLNSGFKYRMKITVPAGTATTDVTSTPLVVDLSSLNMHFWQNVRSDGGDIRITDQYGQQELPIDIAGIDTTGRTGTLWFKSGKVFNAYDTDFYIYYGNASATGYASNAALGSGSVWSDYKVALHLEETANTTAGGYKNAVGSNDGTGVSMSAGQATGKLGKGSNFDNTDDTITFGSNLGMVANSSWLRVWFYYDGSNNKGAFIKVGSASTGFGFGIGNADMDTVGTQLLGIFEAVRWIPSGYIFGFNSAQWFMCDMVVDASGVPSFYINGATTGPIAGTTSNAPGAQLAIGSNANSSRYVRGPLDEVRVAQMIPSAARVNLEYKNQNAASTFYTLGKFERQTVMDGSNTLLRNGNLVAVYETSFYYPNGRLKFQGQINRLEASFAPEVNGLIKAICHSDGRDMDNFVARAAPFTFTGDQSQTSQNATVVSQTNGGKGAGWDRWGQTWTANATTLGRIQLLLVGTAHVTINVYSGPGLGGGLLASTTQFVNVGGATVIDFAFSDLVTTVIGTSYFYEVITDAGESITIYCSSSNPYASGQMYESVYGGGSGGGAYGAVSGYDMYFTTASGVPGTLATFTGSDPTAGMALSVMNDYATRAGNIAFSTADLDATGLSLTASVNTNTIYEAIDKFLGFSPSGFYYYVDIALNRLKFKRTGKTADYILVRGRHIEELDLAFSIENVINEERFSGGTVSNGPPPLNLYRLYTDATSKALFGPRLNRKSDNRVTVNGTADAIGTSDIQQFKDEQYYTTVTILAKTMNITDIKLGQLVGTRGYQNYIDTMLLQITKIDYSPERAVLQLGTLPLRFNQGFEDVIRGLVAEQTVNNPSTPS